MTENDKQEQLAGYQLAAMVSEFGGYAAQVPFAEGIDRETFADDPDPMFVTLPLVEVGGKSDSGLPWDGAAAQRLVQQINSKRPGGILGHVPPQERRWRFDLPVVRWVGATLEGDRVWGKAYVSQARTDVRDYFKQAKRVGARVGTSVYGLQGKNGLAELELESIDLGPPERVSNPASRAVPEITAEMSDEENTMTDANERLVMEYQRQRDELRDDNVAKERLIAELQDKTKTLDGELKQRNDAEKLVAELRGIEGLDGENLKASVQSLVAELADLRAEKRKGDVAGWIAELVELEDLRPIVAEHVGDTGSKTEAAKLVQEYLERPEIKLIAESLVRAKAGPGFIVNGEDGSKSEFKVTDEATAEARRYAGI